MEMIPLAHINTEDHRYCISFPTDDAGLAASIGRTGILLPVVLLRTAPYIIVSGFRRINAAMALGIEKIPAIVADLSEKEATLFSILDNGPRGLNLVEKAIILGRITVLGFSPEEIGEIAASTGIDCHEKVFRILSDLASAAEEVKMFVARRITSLKSLDYLMSFPADEQKEIVSLFMHVHTSESFFREILELLRLLKVKNGSVDFAKLRGIPQAEGIRGRIREATHPVLSSLMSRLKEAKTACALPPGIDIKVDPYFEKEYIDIWLRARDEKEAEAALAKLKALLENGRIGEILELTHGAVR